MAKRAGVVEELEKLFPGRVTGDVSQYLTDWWPLFWIDPTAKGDAVAAVRPSSIDDIVRLVKFASTTGVKLLVRGGGSSVTGASVPEGSIVLDMRGLNQVLDIDDANRTTAVQVGVTLEELEKKLNPKGFTLSQIPQSFDQATVGGYISTFGSGQYSTLYGGIEDGVLRLEVVLPDGEVVWTRKRGSPRSSMGPDLSRLFIGAEGSLGIITAAELKIRKLPRHVWKVVYGFSDYETALNECKLLLDLDVKPAVCRVYNETESLFQFGEQKCVVLLVYHFSTKEVMEAVTNQIMNQLGQKAELLGPELVDTWLRRRFNYRTEIENVRNMGYLPETVEVGVKWSRLSELYTDVVTRFRRQEGIAGVGAHVSHLYAQGACIYFTFLFTPDMAVYWKIWDTMADIARVHDATLSHHHGVGALKSRFTADEIPSSVLDKLKQAFDPGQILNGRKKF